MKILNKEEFAYNVSNVTGFTDTVSNEIITKSLVGGKTASLANVKLGIKGTLNVPIMDSTLTVQDSACGLSETGTTTFTQVSLSSEQKTVFEKYCNDNLYSTYQSLLIKKGQDDNDDIPFEQQIAELKGNQIEKYIEEQLWQATSGTSAFSGYKEKVAADVYSVSGATFDVSKSITTSGNPIYEVDKILNALADDAISRDDIVVWMSHANFRKYVQALRNANLFHIPSGNMQADEILHPNAPNVKVVATAGLASSDMVVAGPAEYTIVGFDLMSDQDNMRVWYSVDDDVLKLRAKFSYSANIVTFSDIRYWAYNGQS